jgi:hypothetical protein
MASQMSIEPFLLDSRVIDHAVELERTYGEKAIAAAKAGLQASSKPEDIDFWASVCAVLATDGHRTI